MDRRTDGSLLNNVQDLRPSVTQNDIGGRNYENCHFIAKKNANVPFTVIRNSIV